jgi:HK97 family phage portal protein
MGLLDRARLQLAKVIAPQNIANSRELYEFLTERGGHISDGGIVVTPETAMRLSAVYACVRVISEDIAKLPLIVYRRLARGKERVTADKHWLPALLEQPNEMQTGFEFREMMQAHLELCGNAFALKTVARREVRELIPIVPTRISVELKNDYTVRYKLMGLDGVMQDVPPDRILHLRGMSLNGYTGVSPIQYQRDTVGMGIGLMKYGNRLFKNGAMIGGVLMTDGQMSDGAYKRLKESFEEKYSGVDNAWKTILLEEGTKFAASGMKADEAQYLESRKLTAVEIAGIYRVPPHFIGNLERATFSNIEQQSRDYVQNGLLPRLRRLEARIAMSLIPPAERSELVVEHLVDFLLRGDYAQRMQGYQIAIKTGWMSRNEVRELENMNPQEGLDEFMDPKASPEITPPADTKPAKEA